MVNSGPNIKGTGKKDGSTAELRPSDTIAVEQPKHLPPDRIRRSPPPTTAPPLPSPLAGGETMGKREKNRERGGTSKPTSLHHSPENRSSPLVGQRNTDPILRDEANLSKRRESARSRAKARRPLMTTDSSLIAAEEGQSTRD
ncbi:mechanosensitive channel of smallconductance-like 10 [Striga asiatica]|uniref:Mechanosensitive channel of smallconductance-like 10 n=1 Tax=Striga asiatica TaxID=4170 RepID=A0A5A7P8W4_STRAF|nr:mechanosensitive channel of smallconductance-like 10 [Striga asiatica]